MLYPGGGYPGAYWLVVGGPDRDLVTTTFQVATSHEGELPLRATVGGELPTGGTEDGDFER